ncbi:MAG: carbohydrate-binding domain-containing protein [Oscillospiraceae bacterium]|jgi:hypothetical protein|nr:carbohydrate-binding domain-containing protein [Oscillospiraceae bacterium]
MKKIAVSLALAALFTLSACAPRDGAAPQGAATPAPTAAPGETGAAAGDATEFGADVTDYTLENATFGGIIFEANDVTLTLAGSSTLSGKLKAAGRLTIAGDGSLAITSGADDCINAVGDITIDGGTLILSTEDDAIHSDAGITINGGTVEIKKSLEGIEAMTVTINGGDVRVSASDDAINASDGTDGAPTAQEAPGGRGGFGGDMINNPALSVSISGGEVRLYAGADGIDSNGSVSITGGTALSFSSSAGAGGEGPIDANGATVLAPTLFVSGRTLAAGTVLTVTDADGAEVFGEILSGDAGSMSLTLPGLLEGETYTVSADGEQIAEAQAQTSARGMLQGGGFDGGDRVPPDGGWQGGTGAPGRVGQPSPADAA